MCWLEQTGVISLLMEKGPQGHGATFWTAVAGGGNARAGPSTCVCVRNPPSLSEGNTPQPRW